MAWTSGTLTTDLTPWIKGPFSNFKYHYPSISQKYHYNSKTMAPRRNYDQAFRAKVVADAIRDGNWCKAARQHGIHESTVRNWIKSSDRHSEATLNNPIAVRRATITASRTRVTRSTDSTRARIPMYPTVETGVLEFIDRKKIEEGFRFTREQIREEARRISRENGLTEF